MDHVDSFIELRQIVGDTLFSSVPAAVEGHRALPHLWRARGRHGDDRRVRARRTGGSRKRGDWKPPWLKIWLVASTGFVSIYTWGFNSWGQAFLIMNLFHAVQYLALVWAMEGKRIARADAAAERPRVALGALSRQRRRVRLGVQAARTPT